MRDKNNVEMKTGDIVKIENAFFKNDNGFYFIDRSPGDISWCGNDYSLKKIGKRGKISTASNNIAFWPLWACCSDRAKNAAAREHNDKYATIEVINEINNAEVIAHFENEAQNEINAGNTYKMRFGEDSGTTQKAFEIAAFLQSIADRLKGAETTTEDQEPEQSQKEEKMSAYVLNQESIEVLTRATAAALQMAIEYPGSYSLHKDTLKLLGGYADDLHMVYRALYITNIKAVNGRYDTDQKTLPKYRNLIPWDWQRTKNTPELKKAVVLYECYLYQCCEDPIADSEIYTAFQDVYKLLCAVYCSENVNLSE